jgi:hypothetical protein
MMHRFIIFVMGSAIAALALAVVSISAVAVIAQTTALLSQCFIALGLFGLGAVLVGSMALRNRVIQIYLARRLLGIEADRLLAQSELDRATAFPETFSQKQIGQGPRVAVVHSTRQTPTLTMPAMPSGWGFDEED